MKPTNVLVDENWNVKVCDFGLSTVKRQEQIKDEGVAPGTVRVDNMLLQFRSNFANIRYSTASLDES